MVYAAPLGGHSGALNQAVDKNPRCDDCLRIQAAWFVNMLDFGNSDAGRHGHYRTPVAAGTLVDQTSECIGRFGPQKSKVGLQRRLQEVGFAIDLMVLSAFLESGTQGRGQKHPSQAGSSGPQAFRQHPLRQSFYLYLALAPAFFYLPARAGREGHGGDYPANPAFHHQRLD